MSAKKTNKDEKLRKKRILDDAFPYLEAVNNHILRVLKKLHIIIAVRRGC